MIGACNMANSALMLLKVNGSLAFRRCILFRMVSGNPRALMYN